MAHLEQISLPWPKWVPVKLAAVVFVDGFMMGWKEKNGEGENSGLKETIFPREPFLLIKGNVVMEGLSRLFEEAAIHNPLFDFHLKCSSLKLTHLCFADDLLIFSSHQRCSWGV